jgi:hypothetical protein
VIHHWGRICGPKEVGGYQKTGENYVIKSFMIYTFQQILLGRSTEAKHGRRHIERVRDTKNA